MSLRRLLIGSDMMLLRAQLARGVPRRRVDEEFVESREPACCQQAHPDGAPPKDSRFAWSVSAAISVIAKSA
jgi:hypothetical protein